MLFFECEACKSTLDSSEQTYCADCYDGLQNQIDDLENERDKLKDRIRELEGERGQLKDIIMGYQYKIVSLEEDK